MLPAYVCQNVDPKIPLIFQLGGAAQLQANTETLMAVSTSSQSGTSTVVSLPVHAIVSGTLQLELRGSQ